MSEPLKLRLGLFDYVVIPTRADDNCRGCIDWVPREIRLKPSMCAMEQCQTLIHELLHASLDLVGQRDKKLGEEDICLALDGPLTMFLRDNPELFAVLMQGITRGQPIVKEAT